MNTYIRFQTQLRCRSTGRPAGIFVAAGRVEDEGVFVTKVRTNQPGTIVYQDEHQVAAKPRRKKHALRV